jgi:hypothetical protein
MAADEPGKGGAAHGAAEVRPFPDPRLTARQRKVLRVIREWVDEYGYPPSVREIGDAVGLQSTSSVHHQLRTLERKGYLRRDPNRTRAVDVRLPEEQPHPPTDDVAETTSGLATGDQARRLKDAGLTAYNHNLDTSPEFYGRIITTRTYDERLATLARVRQAGITVCCGGIIGMGEDRRVRYGLLRQLSSLDPHPESVPVNLLMRVDGTPLGDLPAEDPFELVRTIATARVLMPASTVRLSAGRLSLSDEAQALCFLAGANSIFLGDRLLTTPNPGVDHDQRLLDKLGLRLTAPRDSGFGIRDSNPKSQITNPTSPHGDR